MTAQFTRHGSARGAGRILRRMALGGVVGMVLPLAGCDVGTFLEVDDPNVLSPEQVQDSANLPGVRAGVIGDFGVAFGGNAVGGGRTEGIILIGGALGDEFYNTDSFNTRVEVDQRNVPVDNAGNTGVFRNLQRARRAAERATGLYGQFLPRVAARAEMFNLAGYTYTILGENYCSGIPFSDLNDDGSIVFGDPLPRDAVFARAVERFDSALVVATGATGAAATVQANLARVGRARALLNLNRPQDAAAAVQGVPTTFVYQVEFSDNTLRQNNGLWALTYDRKGYGVSDREGGVGAPFRSAMDPRVPWIDNGLGIDGQARQFAQARFRTQGSPIPVATGVEARLIEAEAALRTGGNWLAILNTLRANPPVALYNRDDFPGITGLQPLTDPGTQQAREDLLFRERAFWLFATGHRLGDLRRQVRQYGRTPASVFPSGVYRRPGTPAPEGTFGGDMNLPVPFEEENNPNFTQCIDRNA